MRILSFLEDNFQNQNEYKLFITKLDSIETLSCTQMYEQLYF